MKTRMDNTIDNYHGTSVADPYRWLENRADPEVKAWVDAQNKITWEFLEPIPQREILRERLTDLWNYPRFSLPVQVGSWYFFQKNSGLQNQSVLYCQKGLDGDPKVVLDPNLWSTDGTVALNNYSVDDSGRYLAYTVSAQGSDRQKIYIRDLQTQKNLPEVLQWCKFTNMAWVKNYGFYYSRYPEPGTVGVEDESNFSKIYWHQIGTSQEKDVLIYDRPEEKELSFAPGVTEDERYMFLHVSHGTDSRNGFYYKELHSEGSFIKLLKHGEAKYVFLGNEGSQFYFHTDLVAAKGRIICIDVAKPQQEHWLEIIPESGDVISTVRLINGQFAVAYMYNAHSFLRIYSQNGELLGDVELPTMGSIEGLSGKQNQKELFIGFTSFLYPSVSLHYDLQTKELQVFGTQELKFNPEDFESSQVFYPSKDGTKVSMYLVHKRGLKLDGKNPTLLYGYGGFNISITPSFSPSRILWLEQGGIYAVANLRGGSEYGEEWHQAGMLENKQNVFDDFIAASEWLVKNNYTNPQRLVIEGRSNGGLLVSACLVQRPDLFGAVICGVPVTDMLRFHKFTVGRYWVPEYGNAEESADQFRFLYKYSPLHNVKQQEYPPTLVVTADGDDRVVPAHAYKFTATLQAAQQGEAPILIRVDTKSGHGHGKPISKIIDEHTDVYSFLNTIFHM